LEKEISQLAQFSQKNKTASSLKIIISNEKEK
jgi:hypothetical protein